jgi:hypothetical protein
MVVDNGDPAYTPNPPAPGAGGYGGVGGDGAGPPVTAAQQGTLSNGAPTQDSSVQLLYPYDGTVWPRGLLAPLLQWNPGAHHFDSIYVHFEQPNFEYKGFFGANNKTNFINLPVPQKAWDQMTNSGSGTVKVSLIFAEGDKSYGPIVVNWKIAAATLRGTIYYNSYGTYLVQNSGTDGLDINGHQYGAATLAIKPGATAPVLAAGVNTPAAGGNGTGCRVCHTVAANGRSLVTQASNANASDYSQTQYVDLLNDTTGGSGSQLASASLVYPALYPDGSLLFSGSGGFVGGGYQSDSSSRLYSLPAGTLVDGVTGLPSAFAAALPVFSPDGKHLAFNFYGGTFSGGLQADQRSLVLLDFDLGAKAFSNPQKLYTPAGTNPVTFSSFLPDSGGVVFAVELGNPSGTWGGTWKGDTSELWWYDVRSQQAHRLDQANGVNLPTNGGTHPTGLDATLNYEPTVNPIASGGYYWVVFTSRRMYGKVADGDPWMSDPRKYDATTQITDKKLWVAAIDLNNQGGGADLSHPAFYLPAQEIHAGNSRGFWTTDVCHPDGTKCQGGDECCGGYCQPGGGEFSCSSAKPSCAKEFEKCDQTSDCCGAGSGIICVNHVCTQSSPIG